MSDLNKKKLIRKVADRCGVTMTIAEEVLNTMLENVTDALEKGEHVMFHGFGTFRVQVMEARTGRNPQTGAAVAIPRKRVVKFRPSKNLKDRVNVGE